MVTIKALTKPYIPNEALRAYHYVMSTKAEITVIFHHQNHCPINYKPKKMTVAFATITLPN